MLGDHVALHYRAAVLGQGSAGAVAESFCRYADRHPELKQAASDALAKIDHDAAEKRCFITRHRRDFLRRVVG